MNALILTKRASGSSSPYVRSSSIKFKSYIEVSGEKGRYSVLTFFNLIDYLITYFFIVSTEQLLLLL